MRLEPICAANAVVRTRYDRQRSPDLPLGTRLTCTLRPGHDGWHRSEREFIGWTDEPGAVIPGRANALRPELAGVTRG